MSWGAERVIGVRNVYKFCKQLCARLLVWPSSRPLGKSCGLLPVYHLGKNLPQCGTRWKISPDPAIPLLEIHTRRILACVFQKTCARIPVAQVKTTPNRKPTWLSISIPILLRSIRALSWKEIGKLHRFLSLLWFTQVGTDLAGFLPWVFLLHRQFSIELGWTVSPRGLMPKPCASAKLGLTSLTTIWSSPSHPSLSTHISIENLIMSAALNNLILLLRRAGLAPSWLKAQTPK